MYKIIDEWKIGVRNLIVLTLNEQIPADFHNKIRINGVEYEFGTTHYSGDESAEVLDAMHRNIVVKTSEVGFIGKEVEFV